MRACLAVTQAQSLTAGPLHFQLPKAKRCAGEGEFGIVYKAMWHGTAVAAKILKNTSAIALGDFRSEIEVLRKVHHPNAVQFLGARPGPFFCILLCVSATKKGNKFF